MSQASQGLEVPGDASGRKLSLGVAKQHLMVLLVQMGLLEQKAPLVNLAQADR